MLLGPGKSYSMEEGSLTGTVDIDRGIQPLSRPCRAREEALYSLSSFTSTFSLSASIYHGRNSARRQRTMGQSPEAQERARKGREYI